MTIAVPATEAQWQQQVVDLAHALGWRHCHTRRAIGKGRRWVTPTSVIGWPDLALWHERQRRHLYAELKTTAGKVTPEQVEVLASLRAAGVEAYLWRPDDLDEVVSILQDRPYPQTQEHDP